MISPRRCAVASIAFLALSASAQAPAKPKPRPVTITYRARGGKMAKAEGTIVLGAAKGSYAGSAIATPNAASGFAKVVPFVMTGPTGFRGVWFNAYDAAGALAKSTNLSRWGDKGGTIGDGTADINVGFEGPGGGIGIMQFTVGQ